MSDNRGEVYRSEGAAADSADQHRDPEPAPAEQLNPYHQEPHEFDAGNPGGDAADRQ